MATAARKKPAEETEGTPEEQPAGKAAEQAIEEIEEKKKGTPVSVEFHGRTYTFTREAFFAPRFRRELMKPGRSLGALEMLLGPEIFEKWLEDIESDDPLGYSDEETENEFWGVLGEAARAGNS